ncbi:MAG TPA: hypothetical protein VIV66_08795 [Pyrinomonadaceae bacterium]
MSRQPGMTQATSHRISFLPKIPLLARRLQVFDLLILVYIAAFVREYFWLIQNNVLAWLLTVAVSLVVSVLCLTTRKGDTQKPGPAFWLIVAVPLFLIYLLRVGYPDLSFDVLNYHIFHSERALRGLVHIPGDFAPAYFPFFNNPVADIVTGVFRYLLGFRLGTAVNFLALLWTGQILFKFFRQDIKNEAWRSVAILLVLFSEQLLSEINNYMVDLLALPLLMEATNFAVSDDLDETVDNRRLVIIFSLLGASVALKLTNLVFVVPLGVILLLRLVSTRSKTVTRKLPAVAIAFLLPILPHALYLYWTTSNPIFPLYNRLFQSPYWINENAFDGRWGPVGPIETLLWPFKILFRQDRLSELNVYSGRMTIGLSAAVLLFLFIRERRALAIAFITIIATILWSLGTGYIRYGLFIEILSGLCLILLGTHCFQAISQASHKAFAFFVFAALVTQALVAVVYTCRIEWGGRPTAFEHPGAYSSQLTQVLRDYSFTHYLSRDELSLFQGVGVWVESSYKTSAITGVLRPDLPYLNLFNDAFISTPAGMQKFRDAVEAVGGRKMVSVTFQDDLQMAVARLNRRGFAVSKTTEVQLPYYSFESKLPLAVLEVVPDPTSRGQGVFNAEVSLLTPVPILKIGEEHDVIVKVHNKSANVWLATDSADGIRRVTLGNKWLDESGRIVINDDGRTSLTYDLPPDAAVELKLHIRAPAKPGKYILLLDLVQEQVAWFLEKGSTPAQVTVTIER